MPDHRKHRGPHPDDERLFSPVQLPPLQAATRDLSWLLSRSYAPPSALKLVGDRYQLAARQRTAVARCSCSDQQLIRRREHQQDVGQAAGGPIWLDGYNVLTSMEAALAGGVILHGRDGCLRDMASMHGSYRKVNETLPAIELLGELLERWTLGPCRWLLDQPVSNSGRLRSILLDVASQRGWHWTVDLVPDPDPVLAEASVCIATADSAILDVAASWLSLATLAIVECCPAAWIIRLDSGS